MTEPGASLPDVSVIMAAWSAADIVHVAIRSALAQKGVAIELIVIDDASPDDTFEAARRAGEGDPRLVLERLSENSGPAAARNRGLDLARGRYVAVLDADDAMQPGRLARLVHQADAAELDIVADDMLRVNDASDGEAERRFLRDGSVSPAMDVSLADYLDPASERRFGENLGYLKPLFRRAALDEIGLRYDETLRNSEDFYLVAELLALGASMQLNPEPGYRYTIREGSISHRLTPEMTAAILDAERGFMARHEGRLKPDARRAAMARNRMLARSHAFESVVDALKRRRPVRALSEALRRPLALPHIAGRLSAIVLGKFTSGRRHPEAL